MEIIASLSSARMDAALTAVSAAPVAAAPDAAAVQQFAALMQAPAPEAASAAVQTIDMQVAAVGPQNFGDRVLNSMQGVSTDFREHLTRVSEALRSDNAMTAQQMMGLQLEVSMVGVQMELASKGISRSTQNLDQLVRVQ